MAKHDRRRSGCTWRCAFAWPARFASCLLVTEPPLLRIEAAHGAGMMQAALALVRAAGAPAGEGSSGLLPAPPRRAPRQSWTAPHRRARPLACPCPRPSCSVALSPGQSAAELLWPTPPSARPQLIGRLAVGLARGRPLEARGVGRPADTRCLARALRERSQASGKAEVRGRLLVRLHGAGPAGHRVLEAAE